MRKSSQLKILPTYFSYAILIPEMYKNNHGRNRMGLMINSEIITTNDCLFFLDCIKL